MQCKVILFGMFAG